MDEQSISFLHLADTHFGVNYAIKPKNLQRRAYGELFFQKVNDVIDTAISKHNVDFILHSGDFFNRSKPPPLVIERAVQPFVLAAKHGIPVYLLPGNHERSKLPLGLISYYDDINLLDKPSSYCFEKNGIRIKITGFPYIRHNAKNKFGATIRRAWNNYNAKGNTPQHYFIMLTHQLIEGSRIENYTFRRGDNVILYQQIPKKFHYIACGHVHRFQFLLKPPGFVGGSSIVQSTNRIFSIQQDCSNRIWRFHHKLTFPSTRFKDPVIAYSGSLERVSMMERNEPKGYIIGKLYLSEQDDKIQTAEYSFHPLSAIEMVYCVWDLSKESIHECVDQTLDKLYSINSSRLKPQYKEKRPLSAVFRIKILGEWNSSSEMLEKFDLLKQEAKRLNIYLTFSYNPYPHEEENYIPYKKSNAII
ncbi:MAG: exonuclease SbcCD subunit D [Candidatus Heimdallarchaeota archaeon]